MSQLSESDAPQAVDSLVNTVEVKLSVFQTLRPEILSEVFLIVAHSALPPLPNGEPRSAYFNNTGSLDVNDTIFLVPTTDQQPWTLMHICRHWRQVALDTPRLWSHIKFELGFNELHYYRKVSKRWQLKHLHLALEWLEMSKQAPLTILFRLNSEDFLPDLHPEIESTIERWENVCILGGSCHRARSMESVQSLLSKVKNLKHLEIRTSYNIQGAFHLDNHPRLKHLHYTEPVIIESVHELESLSGDFSVGQLHKIMRFLPHLSTLDVSLSGTPLPTNTDNDAQLTNPLQVVKLPHSSIRATGAFLRLFDSPSIHKFSLMIHSDRRVPVTMENRYDSVAVEFNNSLSSPLSAFLGRISQTLTTFSFSASVNDTVILPLLALTPNLKYLDLIVLKITQMGMHRLSIDGPNPLCPILETLKISTRKSSRIYADPLVKMVKSRLAHNPTFKAELNLECDKVDLIFLRSSEELKQLRVSSSLELVLCQNDPSAKLDFAQGSILENSPTV